MASIVHEGGLDLSHLTSPEGLELPDEVTGHLNLSGLTSAEGLKLPDPRDSGCDGGARQHDHRPGR